MTGRLIGGGTIGADSPTGRKIMELLGASQDEGSEPPNKGLREKKMEGLQLEAYLAQLKEHAETYQEEVDFEVGDLVVWKKGMKNKKGVGPYLVMEVGVEYKDLQANSGSPYFAEGLDCVLAEIALDGEFLLFAMNSKRFKKFTQ